MLKKILDTVAKMGFLLRGDPPQGSEREIVPWRWGEAREGWSVSAKAAKEAFAKDETAAIYVALRNESERDATLRAPDWPFLFRMRTLAADGREAALTPYGRAALREDAGRAQRDITLGPGQWASAELPMGAFYETTEPGQYQTEVWAHFGELELHAPPVIWRRLAS